GEDAVGAIPPQLGAEPPDLPRVGAARDVGVQRHDEPAAQPGAEEGVPVAGRVAPEVAAIAARARGLVLVVAGSRDRPVSEPPPRRPVIGAEVAVRARRVLLVPRLPHLLPADVGA